MATDTDPFYVSFTRDAKGDSYCTIVSPREATEVRFPLPELEGAAQSLAPAVFEAARRAAPALPEGPRVGIMTKVAGAPEALLSDGGGDLTGSDWDPAKGRFFEDSSIPFDDLMLCVERGEHDWRFHSFAGQDRCTRCQVLQDGSYIL